MSRTINDSLQQLMTLAQSITTLTLDDSTTIANPYTFLREPHIPGGTIDPATWGITLPLGLWTAPGYSQETRESGSVGTKHGTFNQYLLTVLEDQYQAAAGRIASRDAELGFWNAFKDLVVPQDGNPCFSGVNWATIAREKPFYIAYAGVQYIGSFIVVSLDERYD